MLSPRSIAETSSARSNWSSVPCFVLAHMCWLFGRFLPLSLRLERWQRRAASVRHDPGAGTLSDGATRLVTPSEAWSSKPFETLASPSPPSPPKPMQRPIQPHQGAPPGGSEGWGLSNVVAGVPECLRCAKCKRWQAARVESVLRFECRLRWWCRSAACDVPSSGQTLSGRGVVELFWSAPTATSW